MTNKGMTMLSLYWLFRWSVVSGQWSVVSNQ